MTSNRILPEFQDFLLSRKLVPEKNVPYYARWVSRFLAFSNKSRHLDPDALSSEFIHSLKSDESIGDWQVFQAEEALRLYLYHFRGADVLKEAQGVARVGKRLSDFPHLLGEMKRLIRMKHYSYSTERTYLDWAKRFFAYVEETKKMGEASSVIGPDDVRDFLSHLAIKQRVSASTQNQAFNALLFLFREVLREDFDDLSGTMRAKRGKRLPVVLLVDEVKVLFKHLSGQTLLMAQLLYGAGLRLMELARLRVKDIDFDANLVFVRSGKGDNDRTTVLPESVKDQLHAHLMKAKTLHEKDLAAGYGEVYLPDALARKYPKAEKEWGWQYVFPSPRLSVDPRSGKIRRHHITNKAIQFAIGKAVEKAHIAKHATVHTLRHSFATHLLMNGVNIREVQSLLGHKNVETTMIYTHVLRDMKSAPQSPLDTLYGN
jgi:integron integrase